ncbi:hypothetical protein [Streptomyces sp. 6N223]|uniref:hypothetical protein n=1 Tax=Streptomyces sp. 6N223 TaxID=3457412 RepID=UPI003FD1F008
MPTRPPPLACGHVDVHVDQVAGPVTLARFHGQHVDWHACALGPTAPTPAAAPEADSG